MYKTVMDKRKTIIIIIRHSTMIFGKIFILNINLNLFFNL